MIEDTEVTAGMIFDNFGQRIAEMVDRLTRDRPDGTKLSVEEILENAYKHKDKEVLLIKFIDRLHNMETLDSMSDSKKQKIALETATVIIPFSEDINLEKLLNILSVKILSPESVNYLNKLYSMKFSLDNYQLPSLIEQKY
jgi:GTP pyrophosphokinase